MTNMKTPSFTEQYDKIVNAYLKNKLDPYRSCACFIGNLLNNKNDWDLARDLDDSLGDMNWINPNLIIKKDDHDNPYFIKGINCIVEESNNLYDLEDIIKLEQNFLRKYNDGKNEDSLYEAMASTLEILKQLHEEKGEIVENYVFTKRTLETV